MTKEFFQKAKEVFIKWYSSDYCIVALAVIGVITWSLGWDIVGTLVFVLPACLYMWLASDLKPVIAVIMMITMTYSLNEIKSTAFMIMLCVVVPVILASFVFNLTRFRKERNYRKGKLFYGMLIAYIVTLLSGITFGGYNKIWTLAILGVGAGVYFVYFLCVNCVKGDLKELICKILFFAGLMVAAESLIWFLRMPDFIEGVISKELRVGWGMSNTIPVFFVMAVPAVVYLGTKKKLYSYLMFPATGIFAMMLLFTLSRGNVLFGVPVIAIAALYGFIKPFAKKPARIIAAASVVACLALILSLPFTHMIVEQLFNRYSEGFFDPHGRIVVYEQAIRNFYSSPIFGVGYIKPEGFVFNGDGPSLSFMWKTHNTFLQILSCSGLVGAVGMIPYFVQRYYTLLKNFDGFKFMALLMVLAYELEGMLDVTFLSVHQVFFVFGLLAAAGDMGQSSESVSVGSAQNEPDVIDKTSAWEEPGEAEQILVSSEQGESIERDEGVLKDPTEDKRVEAEMNA